MTPVLFSVVATDTARAERAERPSTQPRTVSAAPTRHAEAEPCQRGACSLPKDTVRRVIRFSYVPEIIQTTDTL
jgi:hypothetical protein